MMKQFRALLQREFVEHHKAFVWSPVLVLALVVVLGLTFVGGSGAIDIQMSDGQTTNRVELDSAGMGQGLGRALTAFMVDAAGATDAQLSKRMNALMYLIAVPFYWVLLGVSLFALTACLYDERKEGSVLFWKSMPVADWMSVASKYVFVAWIAPLITITVIFIAQLYAILVIATMVEDGSGSRVLLHSGLLVSLAQLLIGYLLNGFVVLPLFAWFMLVSSWANRAPLLWALGVPIWLSVLDGIVFDANLIGRFAGYHGSMQTLPRTQTLDETGALVMTTTPMADQFSVLLQGQFWVGLMVGVALLAVTVYLRRAKNEI